MKLLVTGPKGQLGSEFISVLKLGKCEIGDIDAVYDNAEIIASDIDITDYAKVKETLTTLKPDIIINCAAYTDVEACESDFETAYGVNATAVKYLALAAECIGAELVHISTDYVFGGESDKPYSENDTPSPLNVYGKSKLKGENYALSCCSKTFIVRTSWLYGNNGKNFVKTVCRVMKEKNTMQVVNDQYGTPTNANDLVYQILKLIPTKKYGVYHCSGKGICTWYDFACEIASICRFTGKIYPCSSSEYKTKAKRPVFSCLAHTALESAVGDEMRDWKKALKEYLKKAEV